jgi:NAD(P)-dependent dehydrogenase (short-subunit alcohol dehydrogenase family)
MCQRFIEAGWLVSGCGRDRERLRSLNSEHPTTHRFDAVDIRDAGAVKAWADDVMQAGDPPDLLINNAAVINAPRPLWDVPVEEFARVIEINIGGMFHVLRAFLPAMIERRRGVIVNFSSGWGRSTAPEVAPYCATKWAVEGLTQALAQELPRGMAAVAFNPGIIDTDMLRCCWGGEAGQFPDADVWSQRAVPAILAVTASDNGRSVSAPGA